MLVAIVFCYYLIKEKIAEILCSVHEFSSYLTGSSFTHLLTCLKSDESKLTFLIDKSNIVRHYLMKCCRTVYQFKQGRQVPQENIPNDERLPEMQESTTARLKEGLGR